MSTNNNFLHLEYYPSSTIADFATSLRDGRMRAFVDGPVMR